VRPVNLIPKEQQRRGSGLAEGRTGYAPYILVGALGLAVLGVAAVVLTSNSVKDKEAKVTQLERQSATAKAAAEQLRPYGNFAQVEQTRVDTVNSLVDSSFNWERVLRSLSRAIPSNVWLTSLSGTVSPDVKLESSEGGSGGGSGAPAQVTSPSVALVGCTYSHTSVARMMVRMRNLDDVSEVTLKSSEKSENTDNAAAGGGGVGGGGGGGGSGDCRTNAKIPKFEILVVIGHDKTQKSAMSASAESAAGSTSPVAAAQGAAATAGSTPSAGSTP
jgi:Tfp pilus assembly protein PilN